jgi:hypothetical protein
VAIPEVSSGNRAMAEDDNDDVDDGDASEKRRCLWNPTWSCAGSAIRVGIIDGARFDRALDDETKAVDDANAMVAVDGPTRGKCSDVAS